MQDIIIYAIPFFIIALLVEVWIARRQNKDWYVGKDTVGSLAMGVGNVITGLLAKVIVLGAFVFVYQYRFWTIPWAWWSWILLFFCEDFTYYWFHRLSHEVRYLWASHVVHHSSRYYNLGTALRQTWTGELSGGFVFWLWLPLVGFHPAMVILMRAISLIYQFWIHTEAIGRMPHFFEAFFNTPSHHRVHHASDIKYLDKNHAGIFIIWDKIFGTFMEEEERPTYGLTTNINTFNPFKIAFWEWWMLVKDVWHAPNVKAAMGYLFGPPGWSHDGSRKTSRQLQREMNVE